MIPYHFLIRRRRILLIVLALLAVLAIAWSAIRPSNDRDWAPDQAVLPWAEIRGDTVRIHNIRNFRYASETQMTPGYYDKTFDLSKLESVWFVVEEFGEVKGPALVR